MRQMMSGTRSRTISKNDWQKMTGKKCQEKNVRKKTGKKQKKMTDIKDRLKGQKQDKAGRTESV